MAVPEQIPYVGYVANGDTTEFPIVFDLHDPAYLIVTVNKEIPTVGTYSVDMNSLKVVFGAAPSNGDQIELYRETTLDRDTNYQKYDNSFRPEAVNYDFDKIIHILQEQHMIDAELASRLKQEIEWRRTHDANFDELSKMRDSQIFSGLKQYLDTILAGANPNIFDGVTAGIVFALDQKSVQTHLEIIYEQLSKSREDVTLEADRALAAEATLQQNIDAEEERALAAENTLQLQINAVGVGNKAYLTYADMDADKLNIPADSKVTVTNDGTPSNNGDWQWDGSDFTKSIFDPAAAAIAYADANGLFKPITVATNSTTLAEDFKTQGWYKFNSATPAIAAGLPEPTAGFLFVINSNNMVHQKWMPYNSNSEYTRTSNVTAVFPAFQKLITQAALDTRLTSELVNYLKTENIDQYVNKPYEIITVSKNLYDSSKKQHNVHVNNNGMIYAAESWTCSDFIPVTAGEYYTISFSTKRQNLAFYDAKGGVGKTAIEYNTSTANPLTVQAPAGANFLVVNIDSNTITGTNVQVEVGQTATSYEPGGKQYVIDATYLSTSGTSKQSLKIEGNNATVSGMVDGLPISINLLLTKPSTHSQSTVFNFASDIVNQIVQRTLNDDVAPMRIDGTTVGANHGYAKVRLTVNAHNKTVADIGSVWTDGTYEWVIVDIISANLLDVTARASNRSSLGSNDFTHVSGASNTASFSATSVQTGLQWYPAIRDRKLNCFVDDSQIDLSADATYNFKDTVSFLESYSIMKKSDIVEWLIANAGQDHANYNAVPAYTVSFGYTFDHECGCSIYFGGVGRKTVALVDQMITQSIQLAQGNGTVYNYIPKAVEFTAGGYTYNFQNMEALASKNPSSAIYLTAARQEVGTNPVDRIVMLNDQVGYATGYLPILDAEPMARAANASNKYLEIRNGTLKLYPILIDSASITSINENDTFACIAYRKYFKRSPDRTCKYVVRSKMGDYLYLDWHEAKTDEIELPADLVGRNFIVHEKSSNVTVLSQFASNTLLVKIDNTKSYGYLVLKFE